MLDPAFVDLSIILFIGILVSLVMKALRQPLIIGYIITGILVSPYLLNITSSQQTIASFSQLGVSLLLFMVGLHLNPKVIKDVGKVSLITGVGQVIFTSLIGYFFCLALGFSSVVSLYLAVALAFSSTIIIMKLLSDKGDLEELYGKISIGFLIVQDLIALFVLFAISSMSNGFAWTDFLLQLVLKGSALLLGLFLLVKYVFPRILRMIAKSQEVMFLFSISWCLIMASIFYTFNFSIEVGALLAGVTLSLSPYQYEISSKMKPLKDFFIILFFIGLGSEMLLESVNLQVVPILLLSFFILVGNPLIVIVLMGALGYTKKTSFQAGLTVAQISEFSIILIALGISVGHLPAETLSLVTAIGLITIAASSYMILYSDTLYSFVGRFLNVFEAPASGLKEKKIKPGKKYDILLFGCDRIGYDILEALKKMRRKFLVVDYNPETVSFLEKEGYDCLYGDASDTELLNGLNFPKAKMVISTIHEYETNMLLINKARQCNPNGIIIVVSHQIDEAIEMYELGATYVIMPHFLGGRQASTLIEEYQFNLNKFFKERFRHIRNLTERKKRGQEHPQHSGA